jgi:hypothetical protein
MPHSSGGTLFGIGRIEGASQMQTANNDHHTRLLGLPRGQFLEVNPALLARFDSATLLDAWTANQNWFFSGGKPNHVCMPFMATNRHYVMAMIAHIRKLTNDVPPEFVNTLADRAFARFGAVILKNEGTFYMGRFGRPESPISELIALPWLPDYIIKNNQEATWMTPEFIVAMIFTILEHEPENLIRARNLWFGGNSRGWLSASEKVGVLEAFESLWADEESKTASRELVTNNGGDGAEFDAAWDTYISEMRRAHAMYSAIPAGEPLRQGRGAYIEAFTNLGIGKLTPESLLEWAWKQYNAVTAQMNRIAKTKPKAYDNWQTHYNDMPLPPVKDDDLVGHYEAAYRKVVEALKGILPELPQGFRLDIQFTPPALRSRVPVAMCQMPPYSGEKVGVFHITPPGEDEHLRREHLLETELTGGHEGMHAWVAALAEWVCPETLTSYPAARILCDEALTVTLEAILAGLLPTEANIIAAGKLWLQRVARIILEVTYHTTDISQEDAIKLYAELTGKSIQDAERDCRRAFGQIIEFSGYALGSSGLQSFANMFMGRDVPATLRFMMEQSGGCLPFSIIAAELGLIDDVESFNWLIEPEDTLVYQVLAAYQPA